MKTRKPAAESVQFREAWHPMDGVTYLNFAFNAPIPTVALDAVQVSIRAKQLPHLVGDAEFFGPAASVRGSLATLLGADPDDISLTTGAQSGATMVAYALRWSPGDEVLIGRGDFPVHYATWKPMEEREDIKLSIVTPRDRFITADDFVEALTPRTRLVSVSHVRFDTGAMLDAPRLAEACRKNGTLLLLDVSQSCGSCPFTVSDLGADFLVCAGYKYLLGPWGTGFLWTNRQHRDRLRAGPYNWLSQGTEIFSRLNLVDPPQSATMSRWDVNEWSSQGNFNLTVMEASLKFVLQAGAGLVHDHCQSLIDRLFERLPPACRVASPPERSRRGVCGCIEAADRRDTEALYQALRTASLVVALREGRIRIAPHLMNSEEDIDRLLTVIAATTEGWRNVAH
jgi:cysteine desulfurase / selenocysteine lyase